LHNLKGSIPNISEQVSGAKDLKMVMICMYLSMKDSPEELASGLLDLEPLALYMALRQASKPAPSPKTKYQRCWDLIETMREPDKAGTPWKLSADERKFVREELSDPNLAQRRGGGAKIATAILLRVNEYQMRRDNQGVFKSAANTLEHVLPQSPSSEWEASWGDAETKEWTHKLGNLALLNRDANSGLSNKRWGEKRDLLKSSPYPLTKRMGESKTWEVGDAEDHHNHVIGLATRIFDIKP
jgi:hypothetical protein